MLGNDDPATSAPAEPFPSFASLKAAHSELLEREPETDDDPVYLGDIEGFFARARSTGELLSDEEERRSAQSILNYWVTVLYRADRKPKQTALLELRPSLRPNLADAPCPYPGLRAFTESESKYFYGRPRQTEYLLARLQLESLLVLLGPSYSGKTSLVAAGLIPELRKLEHDEETGSIKRYILPSLTPGSNPLESLAQMLEKTGLDPEASAEKYYEKLKRSPEYLKKLVEQHLTMPVVIFVDRFEEIFTLCRDGRIREAFVNNLMGLNGSDHRIILSMSNDDFAREIEKLPKLKESFERGSTTLSKLGSIELSDAITRPAEIVGWKLEDSTVKEIVQEIVNEAVGLPLLQFTLLSLWEKRIGDEPPEKFFKRMGGCREILVSRADTLYKELSPQQREAAESILSRLIRVDLSMRAHSRRALREELYNNQKPQEASAVLNALEKANLVRLLESTQPSDVQVELAHESLIFDWPVMMKLVEGKRRRRYRAAALGALLIMLFWVGLFFYGYRAYTRYEARVAKREQQLREGILRSVATKWAAGSSKELADRHLDLAFLLGLAAFNAEQKIDPSSVSVETRGALLNLLNFNPRPKAFLRQGDELMAGDVALNQDGTLVAANDVDGKIVIWDVNRREPLGSPINNEIAASLEEGLLPFSPLAFSPDGQTLASGSVEQEGERMVAAVSLWDVSSHNRKGRLRVGEMSTITYIAFSPDGRTLVASDLDGGVVLLNLDDGSQPRALGTQSVAINVLQFSPDGKLLAGGGNDGKVILWEIASGRTAHVLGKYCACREQDGDATKAITSLIFDAEGHKLIVGSTEDVVRWDVSTGKADFKLVSDQHGQAMFLALSADGKTLQAIDASGGLYLWDMNTYKRIGKSLLKEMAAPWSLSFSRDGRMLATSGENGLTVWDVASQRALLGHSSYVEAVAFSPDNQTLASGSDDGRVILWNTASRTQTRELTNKRVGGILSLAYNPGGNLLACGLVTGLAYLWDINNESDEGEYLELRGEVNEPPLLTAIAFSDDKTVALVSTYPSQQGSVYLTTWDTSQLAPATQTRLPLRDVEAIESLTFSRDGKTLIIAARGREAEGTRARERKGGALILWDVSGNKQRSVLKDFEGEVSGVSMSSDGKLVAMGMSNNQILLWKPESGESIKLPVEGQPGQISQLAFSPDNKTVAATINPGRSGINAGPPEDEPGMALLWDIETEKQLGSALVGHDGRINALAFSPDSKWLATGGADKSVLIWNMDASSAKALICGIVNRDFTAEEITAYQTESGAEVKSGLRLNLNLTQAEAVPVPKLTNPCR